MKTFFTKIIKKFKSSILAEYLPVFLIILVLLFGAFYLADKTSQKVVWYGIPSKISTSGDFRFYPSDEKGQRLDEHWFWAVPEDIGDVENIQKIYEILEPQGLYKIIGIRDEDDCGYYKDSGEIGDFPCVASLTIIDIIRVGTTRDESSVQYAVGGTYDEVIDSTIPILNIPLRYFTDDSVAWGSVNTTRDSNDKNTWSFAAIDGGDAFQSFPITTITLQDFSNESHDLSITKELKEKSYYVGPIANSYEEQVEKYGDLAIRFLAVSNAITWVKEFDVDLDGKAEKVVGLCGIDGNHCPHEIIIVKDNKQIFSTSAGLTGLDISKTDTGNGFYVQWVPTEGKWDRGLCCPLGYIKTRFVYKDGMFMPVYEQEVLYFKVENVD